MRHYGSPNLSLSCKIIFTFLFCFFGLSSLLYIRQRLFSFRLLLWNWFNKLCFCHVKTLFWNIHPFIMPMTGYMQDYKYGAWVVLLSLQTLGHERLLKEYMGETLASYLNAILNQWCVIKLQKIFDAIHFHLPLKHIPIPII